MVAQRSSSLSRNIVSLWFAYGVRLAMALVFVPYIANALGASRYGIWGVLFQIINYLALLDFGFEKAVVNFVATFLGRKDFDRVNRVIAASTRLYFWFGAAAVAAAALCSWFLLPHLRAENLQDLREGQIALVIIGIFAGVRFWFTPVTAALGGFQRYDILTVLQVAEDVLRTVLMIGLLSRGFGLIALALTVSGVGLVRFAVSAWWLKRAFPQWRAGITPDAGLTRDLFSYSRITFGITVAWLVIFNTDSILLGFFASTAAAGIYAPATQLALYMRHLVNAMGTPLTAAVSHAQGASELERARSQYLRLFAFTSYAGFALMSIVTIFARPFVHLWLPVGFEGTGQAMIILAIGSAVFIPHILSNSMLFALNHHRYLLATVIAEALLKLILAAALVGRYGTTGIALANAIPQILLYLTVFPFLVGRSINLSPIHLLGRQLRSAAFASLFTLPAALAARAIIPGDTWPGLVTDVAMVSLFAIAGLWFSLSAGERRTLWSSLAQRF